MSKRMTPSQLILSLVIALLSFGIYKDLPAQEKIIIAYSGVSGFQGPLWTFNDLKLALKYGLDPETVMIVGGQRSIQGLLSGHIHFNLSSATAPMGARRQGADLVIVAVETTIRGQMANAALGIQRAIRYRARTDPDL